MASASGESAARQRHIKASHRNASLSFLITNLSVVHNKVDQISMNDLSFSLFQNSRHQGHVKQQETDSLFLLA